WLDPETVKLCFPQEYERRKIMIPVIEQIYLLKKTSLFSGLAGETLRPIAESFVDQKVQKNDIIFSQGDAADSFYLILSGTVQVSIDGKPVRKMSDGDCFGELALLEYLPRSATVKALDNCKIMKLGKEDFLDLIHEYPEISMGLMQTLSKRLRTNSGK
ncbi:cyclic nucleotide-binding domain-containing protein, partial [Desulfobacterales bacterium HSG17]|nr:cyclic nucleotide-binding domain-containing protein [Desulfobacterales bacterium HSG17]